MKIILIIVITATIALIGSQFTFNSRKIPLGTRHILLTGTEFIFIGLLIGPGFLQLINPDAAQQLHPFLSFGLGWIGFLFGLQFDINKVRFLPKNYFSITAVLAIITMLVVFWVFWVIFIGTLSYGHAHAWVLAMIMAAVAACTGQSSMAIVHRDHHIPSKGLMNLFRYIAAVDALFSIMICGLALCYHKVDQPFYTTAYHLSAWAWFIVSLSIGGILGFVFHFLSYHKVTQDELLLVTIGLVMFASGISLFLKLSPLLVTFAMGFIVANRSSRNTRVLEIMIRSEKSVYILLVILAGASWQLSRAIPIGLAFLFIVVRAFGKYIGGFVAAKMIKTEFKVPTNMGLGLLSQGGVAIAILVNVQQVFRESSINLIFTIIIIAIIVNEFISPRLVIKLTGKE
ncbi:cation:proton antiporter [candidate division KSB1 bacterium]|nr:cation:proton antiporter [candidate division KSB1 bacterium]